MSASTKIRNLTRPNRASDPSRANTLQQTIPFTQHMWSGDRAEAWHLEILGVHPDHQGKGIGKLLVRQGLEQADKEGICASVTSARGKDDFYRSCGYEIQEGHVGMGEGNPLADAQGGNMWWKRPVSRAPTHQASIKLLRSSHMRSSTNMQSLSRDPSRLRTRQ